MKLLHPKQKVNKLIIFSAKSYLNAGELFHKLTRKEMDWKLDVTKTHTKEEGENNVHPKHITWCMFIPLNCTL